MLKEWVFPPKDTASDKMRLLLQQRFNIPSLAARVMVTRGIDNLEKAEAFLKKDTECFHAPFLMKDMEEAAEVIKAAVKSGKKITVYGDYDVDGITSTAFMVRALRELGANIDAYIPDRKREGYGVNKNALRKIADSGTQLVITVDTGITAVEEAEYAKELGLELIITDHHECKEVLPNTAAVVNPKRPDCKYPFKELAGVGVAFKVICSIVGDYRTVLEKYGDIVALGTIADVVSLTDENRVITDYGIKKMTNTPNPGLRAVMELVGDNAKWNSSSVVSYSIAPRLNAAGRMSSAMTAVNLLLTENAVQAKKTAVELDEENRRRQREEGIIFAEAAEMIEKGDFFGKKVLVLAKKGWHHGIIGVVASRICDKYNKSCILISVEEDMCKSSGRSVEGLNLFDALSSCKELLEKFGGHAYAAGFSLKKENIDELDIRLNEYADGVFRFEPAPKVYIDAEAQIGELTLKNVEGTDVLCPYGAGNKTPIFAIRELCIVEMRQFSGGKHCCVIGERDGQRVEIIAFGKGALADEFSVGDIVDAAGELNINIYNGTRRVQLVLADMRMSRGYFEEELPSRADFADVYRCIKSMNNPWCMDLAVMAKKISFACRRKIRPIKLFNCLRVFADVGILKLGVLGSMVKAELAPNLDGKKYNLAQSKEYIRIKNEILKEE